MPEKQAKTGQTYSIDGKTFIWTTDEGDKVKIPMRLKVGVIRSLAGQDLDDISVMFDLLDKIAPKQQAKLDEQDVNDFTSMFLTWQDEYNLLNKVSLGEPARSSD